MRKQGATIVDVRLPKWLLDAKGEYYNAIRYPEFVVQIADYLATLGPKYPKNITELIDRSRLVNAPRPDGASPNPGRWSLMVREAGSGTLNDYQYTSVNEHASAAGARGPRRHSRGRQARCDRLSHRIASSATDRRAARKRRAAPPASGSNLANLSGFPDLIVPAGFTTDDLPVGDLVPRPRRSARRGSSRSATASSRRRKARRLPVHTPLLPGRQHRRSVSMTADAVLGQTTGVRAGHEIDRGRARALSRSITSLVFAGPLEIRQFEGGQSNPTYFLHTAGRDYVAAQETARPAAAVGTRRRSGVSRDEGARGASVPVPPMLAICATTRS